MRPGVGEGSYPGIAQPRERVRPRVCPPERGCRPRPGNPIGPPAQGVSGHRPVGLAGLENPRLSACPAQGRRNSELPAASRRDARTAGTPVSRGITPGGALLPPAELDQAVTREPVMNAAGRETVKASLFSPRTVARFNSKSRSFSVQIRISASILSNT